VRPKSCEEAADSWYSASQVGRFSRISTAIIPRNTPAATLRIMGDLLGGYSNLSRDSAKGSPNLMISFTMGGQWGAMITLCQRLCLREYRQPTF
jgi:hypothetical protein